MKILLDKIAADSHLGEVARTATSALALKILATVAMFLLHVQVARLVGLEGAGRFFLAFTISLIGSTIIRFGFENLLVRYTAAGLATSDRHSIKSIYILCALTTVLLSIILFFTLWNIGSGSVLYIQDEIFAAELKIVAFIVPFNAFNIQMAAILKGQKRIRESLFFRGVLPIGIALLLSTPLVNQVGERGVFYALAAGYFMATVVTMLLQASYLKTVFANKSPPVQRKQYFLAEAYPLFILSLMGMVIAWSATLALGWWGSKEDVGLYGVANRTAMLISFVLVAVNSIAAPKFAELWARGEKDQLSVLSSQLAAIMAVLGGIILIILVVAGSRILQLFGPEFVHAWPYLVIMGVGQFVNVATGSGGAILIMTGHEVFARNSMLFSAMVAVLGNVLLVPRYGAMGAAIATALAVSIQNLTSAFMATHWVGISSFPNLKAIFSIKPR